MSYRRSRTTSSRWPPTRRTSVPRSAAVRARSNNPANWIWWGSFGVFSAFPYTLATTVGSFAVNGGAAPLDSPLIGGGSDFGAEPSSSNTLAATYGLVRTLYHVTRKPDADCAEANKAASGACNTLAGGPTIGGGVNDVNVAGGTSGVSGGCAGVHALVVPHRDDPAADSTRSPVATTSRRSRVRSTAPASRLRRRTIHTAGTVVVPGD